MSESESPAHCSFQGCTRSVHGDTGLCIFHAPADKKDPQEFRNALARQIREWRNEKASVWDFTGWVFVDVDRKPHEQWAWNKYNMFNWALFPVDIDFGGAKFETDACFISSKFWGHAYFHSALFTEYVNFNSAQFTGEANFGFAQFMGEANFGSVWFTGNALFTSAQFSWRVSFHSSRFTGHTIFENAQFAGEADFRSVQFTSDASFQSVRFIGDAYFGYALFTEHVSFHSVQFMGHASFHSAQFLGEADFVFAQFIQDAYFSFVQFTENAVFNSAKFNEDADFNFARFTTNANFGSAEFKRILDLEYASFGVLGDFTECNIRGHVELIWPGEGKTRIQATKGKEDKNFTAAAVILRGKLLLKNLDIASGGVLDLRRNSLAPDCELVIENCNMERILLEGTDCTQIRFYDCIWPGVSGRQTVGDEWLARPLSKRNSGGGKPRADYETPEWRLIEATYQQLAKKFREDFNHITANYFDCGVFEMRRLAGQQRMSRMSLPELMDWACKLSWVKRIVESPLMKKVDGHFRIGRSLGFLKRWLGMTAWYRYLSNYSESCIRPLTFLVLSILLFTGLYRATTFTSAHSNGLWTFWDYLGLSLQVSYLNRSGLDFARGNSIGVNVLMAVQVVFTATLVALFIFAVRRRFRHG